LKRIRVFFSQIGEYISNLPFKTYVTVLLEGIGLFANLIAIASFFGARNTPEESPNFYINNQEFLVWSLVAGIYTLGLLSARFKRRWRYKLAEAGIEEEYWNHPGDSFRSTFFRSELHYYMFVRDFSFTLAITFPLTYLYIRALDAAYTEGMASPWVSLGETFLASIPVTFFLMIASSIFDKALSLYAGD
jgi:hypothetical protein